jgi:hypothetical protein
LHTHLGKLGVPKIVRYLVKKLTSKVSLLTCRNVAEKESMRMAGKCLSLDGKGCPVRKRASEKLQTRQHKRFLCIRAIITFYYDALHTYIVQEFAVSSTPE